MRITRTRYAPGTALPRHHHTDASLSLVIDGSYTERVGARNFDCRPFTAVYKTADLEHTNDVGAAGFGGIFVEVAPAARDEFHGLLRTVREVHVLRSARVHALIARIATEIDAALPGHELIAESCALELWATLARDGASQRSSTPAWLRRARDYLDAHCSDAIGLAGLAREVGVHPAHLAQEFRRHFGCSVGEYVRERRLDLAHRLLSTTDRSIGEIAIEAGFADHSHLTRAFRLRSGSTPSALRRARAS